jgi:hypothetical protein
LLEVIALGWKLPEDPDVVASAVVMFIEMFAEQFGSLRELVQESPLFRTLALVDQTKFRSLAGIS